MLGFSKLVLYLNTIRYLKPVQVYGRILFKLRRPKPDTREAPSVREKQNAWQVSAARNQSIFSPDRFKFLNQYGEGSDSEIWNSKHHSRLWLYNLHYFDDLNAINSAERSSWHFNLIKRWISENTPGYGVGWEPYPLSLRIVNWIKWTLSGNSIDHAIRNSLAIQVRYLCRRIEFHILGNHLFTNAKALVFAGCFFEGKEAENWLKLGIKILEEEISEQILEDGGHFERSPMYHALAFEDMLDLTNLAATFPKDFAKWKMLASDLPQKVESMGGWLKTMCHPDGEISFFNDAAKNISPSPEELFDYAKRLGYEISNSDQQVVYLKESGYIRVEKDNAVLLIDVAQLGPEYLPAHAHADTLSYELSVFGQRVIVNSGTSRYGLGVEREYERSTAAHTTLEINGLNSSEVWAGFRVARRAYPSYISVKQESDRVIIEAAHTGYRRLKGQPVHKRSWVFGGNSLKVSDAIEGDYASAISYIHLHPSVSIKKADGSGVIIWQQEELSWKVNGADVKVKPSRWCPEFGLTIPSSCLSLYLEESVEQPLCDFSLFWGRQV